MSDFTTTIRNYIESFSYDFYDGFNNPDGTSKTLEEKIDAGIPHLFDFPFPWYDASTAQEGLADFKKAFVLHYYMHEIGFETIELFKLHLRSRLTEDMPRYSELFRSVKMEYDPLINHDFTSSYDDSSNRTGTAHSHASGSNQSVVSDVPQINFTGRDFASGLNRAESGASNDTTDEGNETRVGSRHDSGFTGGSKAIEIARWRDNILNLNKMLIDSCEDLFMGVYGDLDYLQFNDFGRNLILPDRRLL